MIKITVPATSANLGIGYDTLGMAVSLYSHFNHRTRHQREPRHRIRHARNGGFALLAFHV